MRKRESRQDMTRVTDVIVIGSGAAGLAAAVTAAHHGLGVCVLEKSALIGGTSAWSGGWLWAPRNPLAREDGNHEDMDAPLDYLRGEIGNRAADPRITAFLETAPQMIGFFRAYTAVAWVSGTAMPDFHERPGAAKGARSVCAAPYDGRALGDWGKKLRPPLDMLTLGGMGIAAGEDLNHFINATGNIASAFYVARRLAAHGLSMLRRGRGVDLRGGNALVARLLRSALDCGVAIETDSAVRELVIEKKRISGVVLAGGRVLSARRGVVVATGGFPHGKKLQKELFDYGGEHYSAAPETNTGDGIIMARASGAAIEKGFLHAGAWAPVSLFPQKAGRDSGHYPHLIDRGKPGIIAVGPDGKRFVNEADSYHDFMSALFAEYPADKHFAWVIADHKAIRRYGLGAVKPFPFGLRRHIAAGYLKYGKVPEALAEACNLPPANFATTLARFNKGAAKGSDADFNRGASAYNRIMGDALNTPNPSLRPLAHAPYYAVRIVPGSLGTFAGIRTDVHARALDDEGSPVPGLYVVGNDMASIFGGNYPSGGITLGPAMTFGYIAGRHLAGAHAGEES